LWFSEKYSQKKRKRKTAAEQSRGSEEKVRERLSRAAQ
jgi:hypothetical protein